MSFVTEVEDPVIDLADSIMLGVVKSNDADGEPWKEVADILSYTAGGATFHIERDLRVGTLVSLMFAMPQHLRCYDHSKELYRIFGLVQFCQRLKDGDRDGYYVGVAFIGKTAPDSYHLNSDQGYRIRGVSDDGLWNIEATESPYRARRHLRYWVEIKPYLAVLDNRNSTLKGERAITENISKSGSSIVTSLPIGIGDRVKFISESHDFSGMALVCNLTPISDKRSRVNLQFVGDQFPVDKLKVDKKKSR